LRYTDTAAIDLTLTAAFTVGAVGTLAAGVAAETAVVAIGLEIAADPVALAEPNRATVAVVATESVAIDLAGGAAADTEGAGANATLDVEVARLTGSDAGDSGFASRDRCGDRTEDGGRESA
jgi:hypothetical protein